MPRLRARNQLTRAAGLTPSPPPPSRPRRGVQQQNRRSADSDTIALAGEDSAADQSPAAATPPPPTGRAGHVTLRMPASRLREATRARAPQPAAASNSPEPAAIARGSRSTRAKRAVVIESGSDDEDEDEEEEEAEEEDAEGEDDDEMMGVEDEEEEEDDDDAEGEDDDMPDAIPPPAPVAGKRGGQTAPTVKVTPADGKLKSVEAKEMQMAAAGGMSEDDDELSELVSDDENGEGDGEGGMDDSMLGLDDDMGDDDDDDDDAEGDTDEDGATPGSRSSTPNGSKSTKRQRNRQEMGKDFLQLPMEPQIKKHLTVEEHAMRRAEMARRRKNLSEKRNEEEKMDTINRLLKKQAPKRRGKISAAEIAAGADTPDVAAEDDVPVERPDPLYSRWISSRDGIVLGLPIEWKDTPVAAWAGSGAWKAVEEVEG